MNHSMKIGICFGLTSGIITTLGLIVGLHAGTHSKLVVMGGIITIAIADAFSDSLGIHISEESENKHSTKEIWESTASTFLAKFLFALTFVVPVLFFQDLSTAIIASIIWGLFALGVLSYSIAREQKEKALKGIVEHVGIALIVIVIAHYVGDWVRMTFV